MNIEDVENVGMIEASVLLESLEMKKLRWSAKICVFEILPKTYHSYKVKLVFDDKTYIERIDQLIEEFETSLFANDRASKKVHDRKIAGMRADLDKKIAECEKIEFVGLIEELKYKNARTELKMIVPDDVIEAFNRQKTRFNIYKICLVANI